MNYESLSKISHGVYVLTTRLGEKDNGCIIDAVAQATNMPERILICVNKQNLTHGMITAAKQFNLSVLTEEAPLQVYQHFGMQSGLNIDKFADSQSEHRSANGIRYLPEYANAIICGQVEQSIDLGSHTLFIAQVTEAVKLSDATSQTYANYQKMKRTQA